MFLNPIIKRALLFWALPVLLMSIGINVVYAFDLVSGLPMVAEDTAQYFFSASYQGLGAIMGLLFIAFVFVYERLERRVDKLRDDVPDIVARIRDTGFSVRDGSLFDEELLSQMKESCSGTLRNYRMTFSEEMNRTKAGEKARWQLEQMKGWETNAHKITKIYNESSAFYKELKSSERKLTLAVTMLAESIAPLALPMVLSLSCLAFLDSMSGPTVTEFVMIVLLLAVYGFFWLLRGITNWTVSSIEQSMPSKNPLRFEIDVDRSRIQVEQELRAVEDAFVELEGAMVRSAAQTSHHPGQG